ncbi:MAG: hypothetical protein HQL69_12600 [Magnetococcales bacterium]|nr:hypothetical protein [Magnetococcales bacterium]
MDAVTAELKRDFKDNPKAKLPQSTEQNPRQVSRKKTQQRSKIRRKGREVVKAGMAGSLAVTMLTGLKILRPMRIHPVASWLFVGLTLAHMLLYEAPSKK